MENKTKDLEERLRKTKDLLLKSYKAICEDIDHLGFSMHDELFIKIEEFFYDEGEEIPEEPE
ncbi:hypothetical protein [Bacillus mycoides]|uniref:hypothetical protein n=1 Tax=Bacillus mycoides TaxID=1405 RepID=UPI00027C196D|nr:hypothetical protein [Bacillus mycoides]EJV59361.1 hypothetical protein IEU_05626 [Bacillus mycoides]